MSYLFVFLSGLLTALPFLFPKLYLLSWISLAPLFVIAAKKKSAYRHGLVFGMGFYILLYYWFVKLYPMEFMGLNEAQSILVIATCWIGLSLLQALEIAFVPFFFRKLLIPRAAWTAPFSAAACWCAFEWLQTLGWTGVPWGRLAVSQYGALPMIQSASLLGSYFTGFLIVLTNGFLALFYLKNEAFFLSRKKRRSSLGQVPGEPDPSGADFRRKTVGSGTEEQKTADTVCGQYAEADSGAPPEGAPDDRQSASDEVGHAVKAETASAEAPQVFAASFAGADNRFFDSEPAPEPESGASDAKSGIHTKKSGSASEKSRSASCAYRHGTEKHGRGVVRYLPLAAALMVMLSNSLFGLLRLSVLRRQSEQEPVKVALIQGNLASGEKWADDSAEHAVTLYSALTREACAEGDVRLVLWPETVLTFPVRHNLYYDGQLRSLSQETGAVLLVGTLDTVFDPETNQTNVYNAMLAYYPDGTRGDAIYYKRHLVPFGEYVPMAELIRTVLPQLSEMNLLSDDLTPGTEATLISTQWGNVGALICFDSIYETLTRDSVRNGAELIALITNDSWYLDSAAVYQHNGHAVLRAVESGRYVARAANTGISSVITPSGEITGLLEPLKEGYVIGEVRFSSKATLYVKVGNLIVLCSLLYIAGIVIWKSSASVRALRARRREQTCKKEAFSQAEKNGD